MQGLDAIRHIPCIGVQGRLDFVCPPQTAYDLHLAWPEMELLIVPGEPAGLVSAHSCILIMHGSCLAVDERKHHCVWPPFMPLTG